MFPTEKKERGGQQKAEHVAKRKTFFKHKPSGIMMKCTNTQSMLITTLKTRSQAKKIKNSLFQNREPPPHFFAPFSPSIFLRGRWRKMKKKREK